MATSRSEPGGRAVFAQRRGHRMSRERPPFDRVLVANRGEIAVRIIRACHEFGMEAVAVYSDADADALHVRQADSRCGLGRRRRRELPPDRPVVEAALAAGAQAVHPGYGFLSERAAFARAVEDAGLVFVGPTSAVIEALGDKLHARRVARSVGVDAVPGTLEPVPVDRADAGRRSSRRPRGSASRCWSRRRPGAGAGGCVGSSARRTCPRRWRPGRPRPWRRSATARSTWSGSSSRPGTSRSSCSAT